MCITLGGWAASRPPHIEANRGKNSSFDHRPLHVLHVESLAYLISTGHSYGAWIQTFPDVIYKRVAPMGLEYQTVGN